MKDLEFHGWSAESNNPDKQNMPTSIISGEEFSGGMEEDEEWYPGKMIGWREGEWFPGKLLGRTKDKSIRDDLQCPAYPLLWESTDQLTSTLSTTKQVDEILAALDICVNIMNDDMLLATATLTALSRVGKGQLENMIQLGDGGACEHVVKLLHFFTECFFERGNGDPVERERFHKSSQSCLMAAVMAVEGLSAGCKENRHRLARAGTCYFLVEILRRHTGEEGSIPLLEATMNTIWQLSFSNKLSKMCFRDAGCENELWLISECDHFSHPVRHRASSVLRWLKSQLVEDITGIYDPRTLSGALLMSVSEISNTSVKGNAADAVKIATQSFLALENIIICGSSSSAVQDAIQVLFLPATMITVARRILRFYRKIFHENKAGLYSFIRSICSVVGCFLNKDFRDERKQNLQGDDIMSKNMLQKISSTLPPPAIKRTEGDDVEAYMYCEDIDAIILVTPLQKKINEIENTLIKCSGRQMKQAGACKLFVRSLALFVRKKESEAAVPPKKTPEKIFSHTQSFFHSTTDTFTKGLLSGLQDMQSGLFGDKEEVLCADVPFSTGPDGECVAALCDCIRLLSEVSLFSRLHTFEENIGGICNNLLSSEYASKAEELILCILTKVKEDFLFSNLAAKNTDSITDLQAVVLIFALKALSQVECMLSSRSVRVQNAAVALLSSALDVVTSTASRNGALSDCLMRELDGYRIIFAAASNKLLSNHLLAEAWLNMCTNIALSMIESKEVLGSHGACDVCMTVLRVHSLRPGVVQCSLWAICVLIGNHPENVKRLLSCSSDKWTTKHSVKQYLQSMQNNKGQTAEARDHANLICCSIDLYEKHQFPNAPPGHETLPEGLVPLACADVEAAEYMHLLRKSCGTAADSVIYDLSAFPNLNSEPFYRFNIVGLQSHNVVASEVTEV